MDDMEILEAAQTVEEEEAEAAEFIKPSFSKKIRLTTYSTVMLILDDESDCEKDDMQYVMRVLRRKQKAMQREMALEADLTAVQLKISEYFS